MIEHHPAIKGYDIIGDIHGCAEPLLQLLEKMGYRDINGIYRHNSRQAIFVGDILDRGPNIRTALEIIRPMVDQGYAHIVLGNHEYNAIRFNKQIKLALLQGRDAPELIDFPRLMRLTRETITQFTHHTEEWDSYVAWFSGLPLFLEGPGFRVVHACWDEALIQQFKLTEQTHRLHPEFIQAAQDTQSFAGRFIDRLTRGTSIPLPEEMSFESRDGFVRHFFRTKFWSDNPQTYADIVFQPDPIPYNLSRNVIESGHRRNLVHYSPAALPVFIGHYWLKGRPEPLRHNVACLDYSAVNFGRMAAYRFDGESTLAANKFIWVYVDRSEHLMPDTSLQPHT